ncbi:hypothetical protein C8R44DRAFT_889430 [Mycena epipterygia]|nr:hypothetical protein C8R44DRAFT_889430 [Mycena epipterygia]
MLIRGSSQVPMGSLSTRGGSSAVMVNWECPPGSVVYNNHLDEGATLADFTVDGLSTSKDNEWAVGEKGKGFVSAMQYMPGMSLRVGGQIDKLAWKKRRGSPVPFLQLSLRAPCRNIWRTTDIADVYAAPGGGDPPTYDAAMEAAAMRKKVTAVVNEVEEKRITYGLSAHCNFVVEADEVCITIIGIDSRFSTEELFSAVYGITPPLCEWRIPNHNVIFFLGNGPTQRFYHREQLGLQGPRFKKFSIDYLGDLNLTSERLMIQNDSKMAKYKLDIGADLEFRTIPHLAIVLAVDILMDDHSDALGRSAHTSRHERGS